MNHEDMIDINDWSPFYFQMSVDKEKIFPLLLDGSEGETHSYENKVKIWCFPFVYGGPCFDGEFLGLIVG